MATKAAKNDKANKLRERIFQTAVKMIAEVGYEKMSIRGMCQALNISVGTFYNYFSSKQEIFRDIYARTDALVKSLPHQASLAYRDEILQYVEVQLSVALGCYQQFGSFREIFIAVMSLDNSGNFLEKREIFTRIVNATIKGQVKGEVRRDMDAREIGRKVARFMRGLILDWCLYDYSYDLMKVGKADLAAYLELFAFNPANPANPARRNQLNLDSEVLK